MIALFLAVPAGFVRASESVGGSVYLTGSPQLPNDVFGRPINPLGLIGFSTNQAIDALGTYTLQRSEGQGLGFATLTAANFALKGRVRATGGNDYDTRAFAAVGFERETLRFPDLPVGASGYLEGAFRLSPRVSNTFRNTRADDTNQNIGGSFASFGFFVTDGQGNPLTDGAGRQASAVKQLNAGGVIATDTMPNNGIVRFRVALNRSANGSAAFAVFSYRVTADVRGWSGVAASEPPAPYRGTCEVDFSGGITLLPPLVVLDSGDVLSPGRVLTETGEDVSAGFSPVAPRIARQPEDSTAPVGADVELNVAATGTPKPAYQWFRAPDSLLSGQTAATLQLPAVTLNDTGGYYAIVANSEGTATSRVAQVTVGLPPIIAVEPSDLARFAGQDATFAVEAAGSPLLSYQWYRLTKLSSDPIVGATSATLVLTNVAAADNDTRYQVIIGNPFGKATSRGATLLITPAPQLTIDVYPGLTLVGPVGSRLRIEYALEAEAKNWLPLTEVTLPVSPYTFGDFTAKAHTKRFYRAVLLP